VDSRLNDIEIKLSYAEDLIDELNKTVFRQQQHIEYLARELAEIKTQMQDQAARRGELPNLRDEIPPHY
jgi:SlyX protein